MVISQASECGVKAMLYMAGFPRNQVISKRDICKTQEITPAFLIKIMQPLRDAGLVISYRGVDGGFTLAKPPKSISLWDIICAIEGPVHLNKCMISEGHCSRDALCKVHQVWHKAKAELKHILSQARLAELLPQSNGEPTKEE
jgi:Rrf2 family protein